MDFLEKTINELKRRNISCHLFETADALLGYLGPKICGGTVGVGDSITLEEIGLYDYLRRRCPGFLDKYKDGITKDEKREIYLKNFDADAFVSGINAISATGKIFNLDGNGSRVAPIIYGPRKVYLICGTNKLCGSDEEAIDRIKNIAAPKDAMRLGKNTPCTVNGKCSDCRSKDRICNYMTIIEGQFDPERITVLVIDRELGY